MHHFVEDILTVDVLSVKKYLIGLVAVDQVKVNIDFTADKIKGS